MARKKGPSLSVGRGEKLSVSQGGGLTAKGRAKYNRATGSNLKAPQKSGSRHRSFCARSKHWKGERGRAARRRWGCRWNQVCMPISIKRGNASVKDQAKRWESLAAKAHPQRKHFGNQPRLPSVVKSVHLSVKVSHYARWEFINILILANQQVHIPKAHIGLSSLHTVYISI